jgi:simple sugar transport system permease protein
LIPIGAILLTMLLFGAYCAAIGRDPLAVFASMHKASFASWYSFQNTLLRASPLMLCALCTALPMRLGLVVIGNEGALVIGGLAAAVAGLVLIGHSAFLTLVLMALAGMAAGGLWIGLIGAMRQWRGVNETIAGLLMNYIAIAILNHLTNGPLRDPNSLNKPSTPPIDPASMLPHLGSTRLHYGLVFGVVACLLAYIVVERTTFGFSMRTIGGNLRAAKLAGLPVAWITLVSCAAAGACAGLAGMVEVAAVHGRANESLAVGYGYAGLLVAFVARHHALGVILVSVLLGGILASGGILQRAHQMPDSTIYLVQGLLFVVILWSETLYGRWRKAS